MAPELIIDNSEILNYRADIWSLGVLLYELMVSNVNSTYPFFGETREKLRKSLSRG
jgi:hypothetical protein